MCADIHTKGFGSSRTSGWIGARKHINVLDLECESDLIGEPGRGWLNWTENPGNYIRKQSQRDPWANEETALPAQESEAPLGLSLTFLSPI